MSESAFHEARARGETKAAVQAVEAQTSAEVMVALRWVSGSYRDADYLGGFIAAMIALVALLYVDLEFRLASFPVNTAIAFALGAFATSKLPAVRRALTTQKRRRAAVRACAREAFVDLGCARTHHRMGILVYVSMLERRVEVVADKEVHEAELGPAWPRAVAALDAAIDPSPSLERFVDALRGLGPVLAAAHPRDGHDNELPDDVDESEPAS